MLEKRKQEIESELEKLDISDLDRQEQEKRAELDAILSQRNQILNQQKPLLEELAFIEKVDEYIKEMEKNYE